MYDWEVLGSKEGSSSLISSGRQHVELCRGWGPPHPPQILNNDGKSPNHSASSHFLSVIYTVVWGECNHSFHNCCMSLWVKQNNRCPLCQQDWVVQRIGKWEWWKAFLVHSFGALVDHVIKCPTKARTLQGTNSSSRRRWLCGLLVLIRGIVRHFVSFIFRNSLQLRR